MNKDILNTANQEFINTNINFDISKILLKKQHDISVDVRELIEQIEAKKRCQKKLPTWFKTANIYYPNKVNIEQTSSELSADYKSKIVEGNSLVDLTGGFGVDCFYFAKHFKKVTHCEINESLSKIVKYNFNQLKIDNIECIALNGLEFLKTTQKQFDCIYIDPSRRHDIKGKVYFLNDCLPNVPEHLNQLFQYSENILIKTSPLLDLSIGLDELKFTKALHIVAINNEVKELLWLLKKGYTGNVKIKTINIKHTSQEIFQFHLDEESKAQANYREPLTYLYEPNAAIMKSGAFNLVSTKLNIDKLHKHSHLYTSNTLVEFPGRRFIIKKVLPYNKKLFKHETLLKANITTRNFPESVHEIRKRFKIKEGGKDYIFLTTSLNDQKLMLLCSKVN